MNLLLISFSFPPAGGVGVLRALSLAKYLPANGIRVDVLTARNAPSVGKDLPLLAQVPAAVTVHSSWTLDLPFALRKRIKSAILGSTSTKAGVTPSQDSASPAKTHPLKRLVANLLLPDPQVGWLPFAFPAARRIIRRRGIDAVLITVPPFSSVRLATLLRRSFPGLPIIVDFRDEWLTTTINLVSFNNNQRARAVAAKAESEAVRDASAIVLVTEAARQELIARYPQENPDKFHCIPNGFETRTASKSPPPKASAPRSTVDLTYIGSVYGSTDPSSFVQAVLQLQPEVRARLRVKFIGHIESAASRQALESLGQTITLEGFVPQSQALRALDETDYLLLITHDRINVSAKFYDYLSGSKPIFAVLHPDGDARRLLDETGAGRWADIRDPAAIANLLTEVLAADKSWDRNTRHPDRIALYHRGALATRYAMLLEHIVVSH